MYTIHKQTAKKKRRAKTQPAQRTLTTADLILIRLLAERDAVFVPLRDFTEANNRNVSQARADYRAGKGLAWRSNETAGARKVSAFRALNDLASRGMVRPVKSAGRTTGIYLTDVGEVYAGFLAGRPTICSPFVWRIVEALDRREYDTPEDDLIPAWRSALEPVGDWTREESLEHISLCLAPFMARDWIFGHADIRKNARYARGPLWRDAHIPDVGDLPDFPDQLIDAASVYYAGELDFAYTELKSATPIDQNCTGEIPLSVSCDSTAQADAWARSAELAALGK